MNIAVLGAGAWGTALAISAVRPADTRRRVTLWARDALQAADLKHHRENRRYLSGVVLAEAVQIATGPLHSGSTLLAAADLVIIATPMAGLRDMLTLLADQRAPVAWLCKGFEAPTTQTTGLLGHEVRAQVAPELRAGVLSGPSFALEVARGQPSALVAASEHAQVRDALVAAFHSPTLRVYANDDIVGVEVGGGYLGCCKIEVILMWLRLLLRFSCFLVVVGGGWRRRKLEGCRSQNIQPRPVSILRDGHSGYILIGLWRRANCVGYLVG